MLSEKERISLYYLNSFPGMYPARMNAIFSYAGSFENALKISCQEYTAKGVFRRPAGSQDFDRLRLDLRKLETAAKEYQCLSKKGIRMIDCSEKDMPARLRQIPDPPPVLFVKGRLPDEHHPAVSIIGSRCATQYGLNASAYFGRELAAAGLTVISGMAAGIDSASQTAALEKSDQVFAIVGTGVDVCYPRSSEKLYRKLCERGGVLSEFNPGQKPLGYHFVVRNRIIAGLCDVLLVMEAAQKSGTSITVEDALNQGKEIFVLPRSPSDPSGAGCNQLIRDGATLLTCPADVLNYPGISSFF